MNRFLLAAAMSAAVVVLVPAGASAGDMEELVDHRIEEMKKARSAMSAVKRMVKGGEYDFSTVERAGKFIVNQAQPQTLKELFPKDSAVGESEAKDTIWANWDDFEQRGGKTREKAEAMIAAAQSEDGEAVADAYWGLLDSCDNCHKNYIKDW